MCGLPFKLTTAPGIILDHLFTSCFGMGSFFASVFVSKLLHSCRLVACACFAGVRGRDTFACVHMLFSVVSLFNVFVLPFGLAFEKKCMAFKTFFVEFLSLCKVHNTLQA